MLDQSPYSPEMIRDLVHTHGPGIRAYFAARVAEWTAVEDLLQETFLAALQSIEKKEPVDDFGAWLFGVARNRLRLYYRRQARSRKALTSLREEVAVLAEGVPTGDASMLQREQLGQLHTCIEALPERAATVIRGRYFEGREVGALAKALATTEAATYMFLSRVRRQLGNCMREALS